MPFINLIHEQRQLIRSREQQVRVLGLASVGLGAVAFLTASYFLFNTARFQVMSGTLEAKKRALAPMLKQLKQNELDQQVLEPKLTSLSDATKATQQWYRVMDHIAVNVPKGTWLYNWKCTQITTGEDTGTAIVFNGYSLDHDAIGELLLRLEACPDLEGVTLKYSQERLVDKSQVLEFEINSYLAGSRKTKKIKEKESA
ncbi:MAG: PilN domain-containing protein [Armatimonadetes bacterium]|nr:PilN domain-containing protein [Armatimonadota bacterium]